MAPKQDNGFFSLSGRIAMVTGAAPGIGVGIARRLAAAGARVAVLDTNAAQAELVATGIDGIALQTDVTRVDDVERACHETRSKLGPVDILVNNAGITGPTARTWELSKEDVEQVLAVNLVGPFLLCRQVVPDMLQRGYGRIVNVASIAGKEGNPTLMPYSASKAGLIAMTKSLAKEVAGQGDITVNAISPAVIATPILEGIAAETIDYMVSRIPIGRTGKVEEIAALVHYLTSSEASFTTGQCYDISGGRATY
jgi:NAD(P)-dependent dehydrogenase (short-subunit alcohol dehydrogenase family)